MIRILALWEIIMTRSIFHAQVYIIEHSLIRIECPLNCVDSQCPWECLVTCPSGKIKHIDISKCIDNCTDMLVPYKSTTNLTVTVCRCKFLTIFVIFQIRYITQSLNLNRNPNITKYRWEQQIFLLRQYQRLSLKLRLNKIIRELLCI